MSVRLRKHKKMSPTTSSEQLALDSSVHINIQTTTNSNNHHVYHHNAVSDHIDIRNDDESLHLSGTSHQRTFSNQGIGSSTSPSTDGLFSKISKYFKSTTPPTPQPQSSSSSPMVGTPVVSSNVSASNVTGNNSIGNTNAADYYQQKQKQLQKKQKKGNSKPGTISKVTGTSIPLDEQIGIGVFPVTTPEVKFEHDPNAQANPIPQYATNSKPVFDPFLDPFENSRASIGSDTTSETTTTITSTFVIRNSGNISNYLSDDEGVSESKLERFRVVLNSLEDIDIDGLRKLSWRGIPSSVRAIVWKLLLGYMPCNRERCDKIIARKRKEYLDYVAKYYNEEHLQKTEQENALQKQIHIDVLRTNPDLQLFQHIKIQNALERILYIWSIRHPASGYVQGLNDLVTPFMSVFLYDLMSKF